MNVKKDSISSNGHAKKSAIKNVSEKKQTQPAIEKNVSIENDNQPAIVKIENYLKKRFDIRNNIVADRLECKPKGEPEYKPLKENDLFIRLLKDGYKSSKQLLDALLNSSFVPEYDPFRDYFARLPPWNMERDHIEDLANYVKVVDRERFNLHFKKALVRSVACALGYCFNKQALILVGKQNDGKSTFIRFLCPPFLKEYIKENIAPDREGRISLTQNFIINLDELATLSRYEINHIKNLFSLDRPKERKVYGRKDETLIRRASFWGSTNHTEFLTDETGSVRWLVFETKGFDFEYLQNVDINKVYAQAYHMLTQGNFDYTVSAIEMANNQQVNQSHQVFTDEMNLISSYYTPGTKEDHDIFYNNTDIILELSAKTDNRLNLKSINITKALIYFGFKRVNARPDSYSHPKYGYYIKYINLSDKAFKDNELNQK